MADFIGFLFFCSIIYAFTLPFSFFILKHMVSHSLDLVNIWDEGSTRNGPMHTMRLKELEQDRKNFGLWYIWPVIFFNTDKINEADKKLAEYREKEYDKILDEVRSEMRRQENQNHRDFNSHFLED